MCFIRTKEGNQLLLFVYALLYSNEPDQSCVATGGLELERTSQHTGTRNGNRKITPNALGR